MLQDKEIQIRIKDFKQKYRFSNNTKAFSLAMIYMIIIFSIGFWIISYNSNIFNYIVIQSIPIDTVMIYTAVIPLVIFLYIYSYTLKIEIYYRDKVFELQNNGEEYY